MALNQGLPRSPTSVSINHVGLLGFLVAVFWLNHNGQKLSQLDGAVIALLALAVPILLLEICLLRTPWRPSTGLALGRRQPVALPRVLVKLVGLAVTLGAGALIYWVFPEYQGGFYGPYFTLLRALAPWFLALVVPYFLLVDSRMIEPRDGYWQLGMRVLGQGGNAGSHLLGQHFLGWGVKLFFLPLMFVYLVGNLQGLRGTELATLGAGFGRVYDFAYQLIFSIDLAFVVMGYLLTLRLFDSHIRSTEPTFLGWGVALLCYEPFWSLFSSAYFAYQRGGSWMATFARHPLLAGLWGCAILALLGVYVQATVMFGLRFSNLTHRGILTCGPYRFTKHPAYVAKNLAWWLIHFPLLDLSAGPQVILRQVLLLLGINFVYFLRARTEERHLSQDPDYDRYAEWIGEHGLFRLVGRLLPVLRYRKGKLFNSG